MEEIRYCKECGTERRLETCGVCKELICQFHRRMCYVCGEYLCHTCKHLLGGDFAYCPMCFMAAQIKEENLLQEVDLASLEKTFPNLSFSEDSLLELSKLERSWRKEGKNPYSFLISMIKQKNFRIRVVGIPYERVPF